MFLEGSLGENDARLGHGFSWTNSSYLGVAFQSVYTIYRCTIAKFPACDCPDSPSSLRVTSNRMGVMLDHIFRDSSNRLPQRNIAL